MRHGRHLATATLAGTLALALVAASTAQDGPRGTATTSLSAVELEVTTPAGDGAVGLVDLSTLASTDPAAAANPLDGSFASAALTPITGPDGPVGRSEARSDGQTSATAGQSVLADVGGPLADLAASVAPSTLTATASADEARAAVETLTATVSGLADAIGLEVDAVGVTSHVTTGSASALQGLRVSQLDLTLGDILPQDVLARLPLPDLLAFLETLPLDLPDEVRELIDQLQALVKQIEEQLQTVGDVASEAGDTVDGIEDADDALTLLQQLATLEAQLAVPDPDTGTIDDSLDTIGDQLDAITNTLTDSGGAVGGALKTSSRQALATESCDIDDSTMTSAEETAALQACIDALEDDTLAAAGVDSVEELEELIDELIAELEALVDKLLREITEFDEILRTLTTASLDLDDLLAGLEGLLADAANTPLVSVSAFDVGLNAVSDGTLDGSSATLVCEPVSVTILDQTVATPSCEEGLAAVSDAAGLVNGLRATLADTLNQLPLAEVVTTGDLRVALFSNVQRSVEQQGDAVVATAGFDVLDLEVPSVTVDPGAVTDLLDQLGVPGVFTVVEGLLADLQAEVEALGIDELAEVTGSLTTAATGLGEPGGIQDLIDQLDAILAGLDLGELGTLEAISTPSVRLRIDPVSTASFTPGAPAAAPPAGAPVEGPSLPNTGGGLAVLGALTLAGAAALRRRA